MNSNQQYQDENLQYQRWAQVMSQLQEMQYQMMQLSRENQELKLNIIAMSPAYSEDQRRAAMEQILLNQQAQREAQQNASFYR